MFDFHVSFLSEEFDSEFMRPANDDAEARDMSVDPQLFDAVSINHIELP